MRFSVIPMMTGLLCCLLIISSCNQFSEFEEIDGVELNAEYAVPLIHSTSTLIDMLNAAEVDLSALKIENDGNFVFEYEEEGPEKSSAELFGTLPDFPFAMYDTFMSVPANFFPDVSLDQIQLKSGTIRFEIVSSHQENIDLTITIPHLKKNGIAFQLHETLQNSSGSSPYQLSIPPISLEGYEFTFPNQQLIIRYEAYNSNNERVLLDQIGGEGQHWDYQYLEGVWVSDAFELERDTLAIDVFETAYDGEFSITNPSLTIELENGMGFPVLALINSLQMLNSEGQVLELESTLFEDGVLLNYPTLNEVNVSKTTTLTFNNSNSNIAELLNSQPNQVVYDLGVVINPDQNPDAKGFITDQTNIKASIKASIPAQGTFRFSTEEIVDINIDEVDEIVEGSFKLITDNGLPISSDLQFYFIDENQNKIDSLFDNKLHILEAAPVDGSSQVISTSPGQVEAIIDAERMARIKNSTQLMVKTNLSTSNDATAPVSILAHQELKVQLGMTIKVKN